ncbi:MAG: hypothetical protein AAF639_42045 [Chloroflexota bacterium]
MEQSLFTQPKPISLTFNNEAEIVVYNCDVNDFINTLPTESVKLIITSPPYNLGKAYENKVGIETYLAQQIE